MGLAQTGTGKTAAFGLPLVHVISSEGVSPDPKTAHGLILAPTRELAKQIFDNLRNYTQGSHLKVALTVGGASIGNQIKALSRGTDLLVATPGRLIDLIDRKAVILSKTRGNKSQGQRERAIKAFKDGSMKVLVATDVAARGLDIPGVRFVYNYDMPNVPDNFVHRIGRTARAGASGEAIAFCSPDEMSEFRAVQKTMGLKIPVAGGNEWAHMPEDKPTKKPWGGRRRGGGKPGGSNNAGGKPKSGGGRRRGGPGKRGPKRAA
ncbi:UNVERIFIED_CONTAM: hypothetical protein GTU68_055385 [Idotea baltica]|nr:hypothetical protein [Idotea baltica]